MKIYSHYGFNKFVLTLGYKNDFIKNYIWNDDWDIKFVDTDLNTLKGGRIKRVEKYIDSDDFHITYGDGVADININELHQFHLKHNDIGTLTAVRPPSRFGEIELFGNKVIHFEEKAQLGSGYINGGFFVFKKEFFDYLTVDCDFEFGPLEKLAKERKLQAFRHHEFWQCMDNIREKNHLNELWNENKAKWRIWS